VLSHSASAAPQWARLCAKLVLPGAIVAAQATIISLALRLGMGVHMVHPWLFWLIALSGSLSFLIFVTTLITTLGDAGKLLAVLLLIFQLAAAGGAFPVEMSNPFWVAVHPYLPVTDIVKAFRAAMFGAYSGRWWLYALRMVGTAAGSFLLAWGLGRRWKIVPDEAYGPAIDL
jgi:putative membrane protein